MPAADLLGQGGDRDPLLPPRVRRAVLAGSLAVVLAALVVPRLAQAREEAQRAERAARAADVVRLAARLDPPALLVGQAGLLQVALVLDGADGEQVREARLEGDGLTPVPVVAPSTTGEQVLVGARLDCSRAADSPPSRVEAVLVVVARSGRQHLQRLPVPTSGVRDAALQACDLPDPDALPYAEASGRDGRLLVFVEAVPRDGGGLVVREVRVPGFAVRPSGATTLPLRLAPDSGAVFELDLVVQDCALARDARVGVVLTSGGVTAEQAAATAPLRQPQPGGEPVGALLSRLVSARCGGAR